MNREQLEDAILDYAKEDFEGALTLITGAFVGLNTAYVDLRGEEGDGNKEIKIEGPEGQRRITIHAAVQEGADGP